jgi:hypothetical protein
MSDLYSYDNNEFEFDKEVKIDVETEIKFDVDVNVDIEKKINVETDVKTNIEGNTAIVVADVEAIGKDTFVELDTSVLVVEDKLSSATVVATAATENSYYDGHYYY